MNKIGCALVLGLAGHAFSATAMEPLFETTTDWAGGQLGYPDGQAQVTGAMLRLAPGDSPPFHCHPVPTMGYVLSGTIEVTTGTGEVRRFGPGDSVVEVMNRPHRGLPVDGPVEVVVFYAGAEGVPVTVLPGSDESARWPCEVPAAQ